MAKFRRGAAAITEAAERKGGSGKFTPSLYWKNDKDRKYIQFITPLEDVPTVDYHGFITVGHTDDGDPITKDFISPQDPGVNGADGYDPIKDRFDIWPTKRSIALAVEVEPRTEVQNGRQRIVGFDVKHRKYERRDGTEVEVPAVGYIIQSPGNFFGWLTTYNEDKPITEAVFKITRRGKGADTSYDFIEAGQAIELDLDSEVMPDLDAYLEELADETRMHKFIDPLPSDFVLNKWAKMREDERKQKSKKKGKREAVAEDDEVLEGEVESESDRRTAFKAFQEKVQAGKATQKTE